MNYTRKEIIKNVGLVGLTLFTPSLINIINNYYKSETKKQTAFDEDSEEFKDDLNVWLESLTKENLKLDVLIINDSSIKNFDFVFLTYNRENDNAPRVVIPKNENYYPESNRRLFADVKILKMFSKKNDIFIWHEKGEDFTNNFIRKIRNCGKYNSIVDDLYKPVSYAYAAKYLKDKYKSKRFV